MTKRSRILMPLAVVLLLFSFVCAMVWETPVDLPFQGIAINVGSSVWHVGLGDWVSIYRTPAGHWPARFWQYGAYAPPGALVFPLWVVSLALAAWPMWWLNRLRGPREIEAPIVGWTPGSPRRFVAALALSHLLASYGFYLLWECLVPTFVRGTVMSGWAMVGQRLVEAPLEIFIKFPRVARYVLKAPGVSPELYAEIMIYCLSYLVMLGAVFRTIYIQPQRRRRATRLGLCLSCGYDLRASPARCPECGRDVHPSAMPTASA